MGGFKDEAGNTLLSHIGLLARGFRRDCKEADDHAEAPGVQWRSSFDLADEMEQGASRELTTDLLVAAAEGAKERRLEIEVSASAREYVLKSEEGEPLLRAQGRRTSGLLEADDTRLNQLDVFVCEGSDTAPALCPAFTLRAINAECTHWRFSATRCECCAYLPSSAATTSGHGGRDLAYIAQTTEYIEGNKIMYVEVELPGLLEDSTPEVWCARTGGPSEDAQRLRLRSRRPVWNRRFRALAQDFFGRCDQASSRNIQLDPEGAVILRKTYPVFLQGKIGENTYVLDYKRPLGLAQAFAIALSTHFWQ
eukprot:TRINITY_DN10721_c0_g1_i1.p1 TRINITY_DN10721_c0_g1~~TRINITY_DN10721_c0_g1_i1.p1  ORF type:complete len:309 (-),score=67.47 TRINITY_DN10721_c0_g1_i1:251-1177(-)